MTTRNLGRKWGSRQSKQGHAVLYTNILKEHSSTLPPPCPPWIRVGGLLSFYFHYTFLCLSSFLFILCFPERGGYVKTEVSGPISREKEPDLMQQDRLKHIKTLQMIFILVSNWSFLLLSENLKIRHRIWMKYGLYMQICVHVCA